MLRVRIASWSFAHRQAPSASLHPAPANHDSARASNCRIPAVTASPFVSMAARIILALTYSLTLLLCRLTPRARRWPTSLPSCVAVTGTFYNPGWFRAHIAPLVRSGAGTVIVVTDRPLLHLAKVRFSCPPRWLTSVSPP